MSTSIQILIIDDDRHHSEILEKKLISEGQNNIHIENSFNDAVNYLDSYNPDVILLDYYLNDGFNGHHLIKESLINRDIPVIIISTFYSAQLFEEVKDLVPMDFIPKNVNNFELMKAIYLATAKKHQNISKSRLSDFIFVKSGKEIKKLDLKDILYITIDGKYIELFTAEKRFLIRSTLSDFEKKLPEDFIRIHKAYIINLSQLDSINLDGQEVRLGNIKLPLSRNFKKDLLSRYYMG
ncbi:MAG: LytTR family DNA-binding domain-containing protein [Saprospiraceae bacterium]